MYECNSYKNHNLIILWHSIKSMVTTLNEGCKPHLTKSGLHIIIHKCANHTKNEMLNCTEVGTPYMVCYAHFRFNGVRDASTFTWRIIHVARNYLATPRMQSYIASADTN